MPRYRLDVEYDGGPYAGWQRQANGVPTVQAALEKAILSCSGEEITLKGAGRTDTGVHATGQVAHIDLVKEWNPDKLQGAINAHLKLHDESVAILSASQVDENFDSRFSAKARHYLYVILSRRAPAALLRNNVWHVPKVLDVDAMNEAAKRLLGHHDFTTFRSSHCQAASPMKTLDLLDVTRNGDLIEVRASARSFLHNQVRSMVGSLKRVGEGGWDADDLEAALKATDRTRCGQVAPACGLYLVKVDY